MISRNYSDAMEEIDCPRILWKMTIHVNEYTGKLRRIGFGPSAFRQALGKCRQETYNCFFIRPEFRNLYANGT